MPGFINTVTGVFPNADSALQAGERAREIGGSRATVRVLVPGTHGKVIETSVLSDKSSYWQVPLFSLGLGTLISVGLALAGVGVGYVVIAMIASISTGAMIGIWLSSELYPRRIFWSSESGRQRYLRTILAGRSVVTAVVTSRGHAELIAGEFRHAGAYVAQGFLHQQPAEARNGSNPIDQAPFGHGHSN